MAEFRFSCTVSAIDSPSPPASVDAMPPRRGPGDPAEQLRRDRERFGFTHWTVHGPYVEAFAPAIHHPRQVG